MGSHSTSNLGEYMGWKKFNTKDLGVNDIVQLNDGSRALVVSNSFKGDTIDGLESLAPDNWSCNFGTDKILNKKSGLQRSGWVYDIYGNPIHKITHIFKIPKLKV
jgi:hypothetical protein